MAVAARGAKGVITELWQSFLVGEGIPLPRFGIDGDFGGETEAATIQWQRAAGVNPTGELDAATLDAASAYGFAVPTSAAVNWPPKPALAHYLSDAERESLFGRIEWHRQPTAGNLERISIDNDFVERNIITINVPQLLGVSTGAGSSNGKVRLHRAIAPQFAALWAAWEAAGLLPLVLTWAGAYAPRLVRGSTTKLSNHAYGTAFDINAAWNGLGRPPAARGAKGVVRDLVPLAWEHGFFWGGWWSRRPDGMHFEACRIVIQ